MQDITLRFVITEVPVGPVEIDRYDMTPTDSVQKLAGLGRKMAGGWHVGRRAAGDPALTCLSSASPSAEDVSRSLSFSSSIVSAGLGVLEECGLTSQHHVRGDHKQNCE